MTSKKLLLYLSVAIFFTSTAWQLKPTPGKAYFQELRNLYSKPTSEWPSPNIDPGVQWRELGTVPASPVASDSTLRPLIELGKVLFFDPRLSGSNQVSCSSCHDPELNWSDGRSVPVGHDHQRGTRNTPTLLNVWAQQSLFWDGRAASLEDQALSPIENPVEMHQDLKLLPRELNKIKGYRTKFREVYGRPYIKKEEILQALSTFQKSITSRRSRFDLFLEGRQNALDDEALWGLHLFRTKARCINCHNGPLFTDNQFHNLGLTYYGRKYEDLGRYAQTKNPEDVGKFKTPGLRDVMRTRPWMHNGLFDSMEGVLNMYSAGMPQPKPKEGQENDPLFPKTSPIIQQLDLSAEEKQAVIAFLESISTVSYRISRPELPQ
ncbi:cytochrome-c peroxidase [Pontibacter actiniarum]|uniref:Cytochrome-c peroxidase n=1 Tax=Pontibacter actiniarum TaxID=323450 RepID=A0A1X9YRH8_9BACT|nr:cytochrome c peroxidase [Pontibacter actiniarum]ARS35468.1 cytochrome-c peroxidase [Pontibacter actiniarum]